MEKCKTCENKLPCCVCTKQLCSPKNENCRVNERTIEPHYRTAKGNMCTNCFNGGK